MVPVIELSTQEDEQVGVVFGLRDSGCGSIQVAKHFQRVVGGIKPAIHGLGREGACLGRRPRAEPVEIKRRDIGIGFRTIPDGESRYASQLAVTNRISRRLFPARGAMIATYPRSPGFAPG